MADNKKIDQRELRKNLAPFGFRNVELIGTGARVPSQTNLDARRDRIAAAHNQARELVGGSDFVFSFEDDTLVPKNAHNKLLKSYRRSEGKVGIVQGVEPSRWGPKFVGAWKVDDLENPTEYTSLMDGEQGDAGGFYCFIVPTEIYRKYEHSWKAPLGPDVAYGLQLRRDGYQNIVNWHVRCQHRDNHGNYLQMEGNEVRLRMYKERNRWLSKVLDE